MMTAEGSDSAQLLWQSWVELDPIPRHVARGSVQHRMTTDVLAWWMSRRGGDVQAWWGCSGVVIWQGGGALPCSCLCGNHVWEWGSCHATWQVRSFGAGLPRWLVALALLPVGPVLRLVSVGPVRRVWGARSSAGSVFDCAGFVHGTSSSDVWQAWC